MFVFCCRFPDNILCHIVWEPFVWINYVVCLVLCWYLCVHVCVTVTLLSVPLCSRPSCGKHVSYKTSWKISDCWCAPLFKNNTLFWNWNWIYSWCQVKPMIFQKTHLAVCGQPSSWNMPLKVLLPTHLRLRPVWHLDRVRPRWGPSSPHAVLGRNMWHSWVSPSNSRPDISQPMHYSLHSGWSSELYRMVSERKVNKCTVFSV